MQKVKEFWLVFILVVFLSCSKNNPLSEMPPGRYLSKVFSSTTITTVQFDVQPDYSGTPTALYADLYQPKGDSAAKRAAIFYVHGGAATRDQNNIPYLCEELAKRGYFVASIDYRFGREDSSVVAQGKGQLRAVQDVKSFIRFAKQNALSAKIDVNKLFITGSSAGGVAVLATAFMDFGEQPAYLNVASAAELEGFGNLNGNNSTVKAVYSMWGAVGDTNWIKAGDIPVGCIHSIFDPTVPWNYSDSAGNIPGVSAYGSYSINARAKNLGIYTSLYGFNSDQHSLGMNFPNIETTITELTRFLFPLTK